MTKERAKGSSAVTRKPTKPGCAKERIVARKCGSVSKLADPFSADNRLV